MSPGRHEPGTGELNYPFIANVLREVDYQGAVGMQAFPLADSYQAMERFRAAFSGANLHVIRKTNSAL